MQVGSTTSISPCNARCTPHSLLAQLHDMLAAAAPADGGGGNAPSHDNLPEDHMSLTQRNSIPFSHSSSTTQHTHPIEIWTRCKAWCQTHTQNTQCSPQNKTQPQPTALRLAREPHATDPHTPLAYCYRRILLHRPEQQHQNGGANAGAHRTSRSLAAPNETAEGHGYMSPAAAADVPEPQTLVDAAAPTAQMHHSTHDDGNKPHALRQGSHKLKKQHGCTNMQPSITLAHCTTACCRGAVCASQHNTGVGPKYYQC